jgi:hypothetical protein
MLIETYFCCFRAKWRPAGLQEEDDFLSLAQRSEGWTPQGEALRELSETCKETPGWQGKCHAFWRRNSLHRILSPFFHFVPVVEYYIV